MVYNGELFWKLCVTLMGLHKLSLIVQVEGEDEVFTCWDFP